MRDYRSVARNVPGQHTRQVGDVAMKKQGASSAIHSLPKKRKCFYEEVELNNGGQQVGRPAPAFFSLDKAFLRQWLRWKTPGKIMNWLQTFIPVTLSLLLKQAGPPIQTAGASMPNR